MNNKKGRIIVLLLLLSLVLVTLGTTLAFFTYKANGTTSLTITSGTIKLHYKEVSGKGAGISISNAMPVSSNDTAKESGDYFEFKITGSANDKMQVPYVVTARMTKNSDAIMGDIIDMYLTEVNNNIETPTTLFTNTLPKYNELTQYSGVTGYTEKIIYSDIVSTYNYEKTFRLRMWMDQNTNFNSENGQNNYNNKTFSITVNVNAKGSLANSNNNGNNSNGNNPTGNDPSNPIEPGNQPTCVSNGYYQLQCSCDNRELSWNETFLDANSQSMDKTRTLDRTYPPSNTYRCSCGNEQGYVVNTGEVVGRICEEQENPNTLRAMILADNQLVNITSNLNTYYPTIASHRDDGFNGNESSFPMGSYASRYITYSETYTYDSTNGTYTLDNPQTCIYSECYQILRNKYIVAITGSTSSTPAYSTLLQRIYKIGNDTNENTIYYTMSSSNNVYDDNSGLYSYNVVGQGFGGTTNGGTTYYFRGDVTNNVVEFAGKIWRVVRINEDGSVRLILDNSIDSNTYQFNTSRSDFRKMYYSNSDVAKTTLENWYATNITGTNVDKIANGNYFCEQSKVKGASSYTAGEASILINSEYEPNFGCTEDGNSKGLLNVKIGLITYDELVRAGAWFSEITSNTNYYLYKGIDHNNNYDWWTMTLSGYYDSFGALDWYVKSIGSVYDFGQVTNSYRLRPVINIDKNVTATRSNGHYVID